MAEDSELGAASTAAVAEAGAAVREPDFTSALAAFVKDQGGAPGSGDEPAPDAPKDDAAGKPAEGDDYSEEDHATAPPVEEPEPKAETKPDGDEWPDDLRKTWDQYPNERERAKALAENKRYGIEQADKNKKLEAELAELKGKAAPPAADNAPEPAQPQAPTQPLAAEPSAEDVRTAIERLSEQDPTVQRAVETLGNQRKALADKRTEHQALQQEIKAAESGLGELTATIKYLEKKLTGNPDNFELQQELEDVRNQALRLETQLNAKAIKEQRISGDIAGLEGTYRYGLGVLRDVGAGEHQRTRAKEESDRTFVERKTTEAKTWTDSFAALADSLKIAKDLREEANEILLLKATRHAGDIGDVPTWMRENAGLVTKMLEKHRASVLAEYGDDKRADAAQPAPRGPAAVAEREAPRPMSSREASRIAEEQMRKVFTR